jgi:hypothetical protein
MKNIKLIPFVLLLSLMLAACASGPGETADEGFEFSEEEVAEEPPEEMVFTEDEAEDNAADLGFDFTEDEVEEPPSDPDFDFTEDDSANEPASGNDINNGENLDAEPVNDSPDPSNTADGIFPPEGFSNWVINYDEGTITCPTFTQPFEASPPDNITIELGVDAAALVVRGMEEAPEIFFFLWDSGPGGSQYDGWYEVPGTDMEIHYQMVFTNLSDPSTADFIMGNISSTLEGCQVSRSFGGTRVD